MLHTHSTPENSVMSLESWRHSPEATTQPPVGADYFITEKTSFTELLQLFENVLRHGVEFKCRKRVLPRDEQTPLLWMPNALPQAGMTAHQLIDEFVHIATSSTNFGSSKFVGFPDAGNSVAANLAALMSIFLNQNLINETFCSPRATFIELETITWLRRLIGYPHVETLSSAADVGGAAVIGGVHANAIALLAARERLFPNCLRKGMHAFNASRVRIVTPAGINHYSIRCALAWLGFGEESVVEVPIGSDYKYDLQALEQTLATEQANQRQVLAVVAYAGDSRTQSIDRLRQVAAICRKHNIWFHVDACHGLQLLFSKRYRYRMAGVELADSIATDPHKVLWIPYNLSYILFIEFCISNRAFIPTVQRGGLMQGRTSAVYRQSDEHVGYLHAD